MKKLMFNKLIATSLLSMGLVLGANAAAFKTADSFVITVQTDNTGDSTDTQFTIPTYEYSYADYNYSIDCNDDGTTEAIDQGGGDYTCSYTSAGTKTIVINGNFHHIYFNNTGDKEKLLTVEQWGTVEWRSMDKAFYGSPFQY